MNPAIAQGRSPNTSTDDSILVARGVRLGYGDRTILDGVSLEVQPGEFWFVIGPNGHGKTTLLRAFLGQLQPQAGRLTGSGDFLRPPTLGFVPQHCALNPSLPTTVREFVLLGLVGLHTTRRDEHARLAWALEKAGLAGMDGHDYWSLSGGQRQRALVARALVRRPRLFIADEPTSGLDMGVEAALLETLAELNRTEQLTLIFVVHDLGLAARYGSHVALVHDGCVEAGPAHEVLTPSALERAYRVKVEVGREPSGFVNVRIGSIDARMDIPDG